MQSNIFNTIWDYFSSIKKETWQDVLLSSIVIPVVFWFFTSIKNFWINRKPYNLLFKGFRKKGNDILIFLSQYSKIIENENQVKILKNVPIYFVRFPSPTPEDSFNIEKALYTNIDPVWSQADGICVADILNVIGKIDRPRKYRIADILCDWKYYQNPIFSVGFNPKTNDLLKYCNPINFQIIENVFITIDGHTLKLDCFFPNDAGIIQRTVVQNSKNPVFILAGLGTKGTELAGKVLRTNAIDLGKLYGNKSFCLAFKTDKKLSEDSYFISGVYPKPHWFNAICYPLTYVKWHRRRLFPK